MSGRISILISGRGSNMLALLAAIDDGRLAAVPALVIANVPQAAGLRLAAARGVETLVIDHRNSSSRLEHDRKVLDALQGRQVDLICLAGYMRVLGPTLIRAFPCRILNIHPSLLPSFPGLHAQRQAIEFGAKVSGCTVHFVDEGVDTGPVILQRAVEVRGSDTEEILGARILEEEHRIYPEAAHLVLEKRVRVEGRRACILPAGEVA
ncbi:MAG: phosphoribosylglycinamide formyltransferase [Acidobacteria bacterium]|nr:phosphoribosylglycinamide formyltransferase [Acidobacteriota bacterium]